MTTYKTPKAAIMNNKQPLEGELPVLLQWQGGWLWLNMVDSLEAAEATLMLAGCRGAKAVRASDGGLFYITLAKKGK